MEKKTILLISDSQYKEDIVKAQNELLSDGNVVLNILGIPENPVIMVNLSDHLTELDLSTASKAMLLFANELVIVTKDPSKTFSRTVLELIDYAKHLDKHVSYRCY